MNTFTGCLTDNRPQYEIEKTTTDELFAFGGVNWEEESQLLTHKESGTEQLMCSTISSLYAVYLKLQRRGRVEFSISDIYQRRQNKGYGGMMLNDALEIVKYGST